ncbi:unnamed protein product [Soboliphyme baturini]|uniref:Fibronectin type-III domain-containing protein n=1 Tax=Soboliphyme baturini TaxID=241478 RepID=A0A183I9A8_9BILA|nr:unnamed protein product [Soboliphyme baturini]
MSFIPVSGSFCAPCSSFKLKVIISEEDDSEEDEEEGIATAPSDFRLIDVKPYAVKLTWTPEGPLPQDGYFVLRFHKICNMLILASSWAFVFSHEMTDNIITVVTRGTEYEITGLDSCTIYAVKLTASDGKEETEASSLIVLTEHIYQN